MNVGMGRVWSLYFMLQLISNFDNYSEVKLPANVTFFLAFLEKISNFKVTEIEGLSFFLKGDSVFGEKEMILSIVGYFVILGICWAIWKNWPN